MRVIALIVGLGLLAVGFVLGGRVSYALNVETLIIVVGGALSFTYVAHRGALWRALGLGFLGQTADAGTYTECAHVLQTLRRVFMATGITLAFIGGINMSVGLDDPATFGPAFAVLLLAPFYGVVFAELLVMPAMRRLEAQARS